MCRGLEIPVITEVGVGKLSCVHPEVALVGGRRTVKECQVPWQEGVAVLRMALRILILESSLPGWWCTGCWDGEVVR